ncbi:hypothetical protein [Pleomorphomonas carboxyditropha]|uniref:Uncharacterized protein n=1 Tax=Pleomorphomonas carboxyditropha TaxID=2023338 RepID=A0A2G9WWW2_9HYPH|nr:hypothetical protein [Pleomorphomonas carboxyditropha]PIO98610.1 hypothetical protein CJ014_14935 [Pleomorphomonas carboxyditropha]
MSFASRSLPPEAEDPPPTRRDLLLMERDTLLRQVRPRVRSHDQERIRRRIADLTRAIMTEETEHGRC